MMTWVLPCQIPATCNWPLRHGMFAGIWPLCIARGGLSDSPCTLVDMKVSTWVRPPTHELPRANTLNSLVQWGVVHALLRGADAVREIRIASEEECMT